VSDLHKYFVLVRVELRDSFLAEEKTMIGYYQNIGVAAHNEAQARGMIMRIIEDGKVDWLRSEWIDFQSVLPAIKMRSEKVSEPSIWYKSGRVLFPQ
jgi:hypothetical protein